MLEVHYRLSEYMNITDVRRFSTAAHFLVPNAAVRLPPVQHRSVCSEPVAVDSIIVLSPELVERQADRLVMQTLG
jgi:hypothetical protein